jgi:hypothetical protein
MKACALNTKTPIMKTFMKCSATLFSLPIVLIAALSLMGFASSVQGQDVEPPTLLSAVFTNGATEIVVTYSEPMDLGSAFEIANYEVIQPSAESRYPLLVSQEDAAGTQFRLYLDAAADAGSSLSVFYVSDLALNNIEPNPTVVLIQGASDTTRPTVVSAAFVNLNQAVIVTYSETMFQPQAVEMGNYFAADSSGNFLEIASITQHDIAGRQYRLNLTGPAPSGSTLTVYEVSDLSFNIIDPNPTTVPIQDSADATAPTVLSAVLDPAFPTSNTIIRVTFSEPMNSGQVFNPDTYLVTGPAGEILPIAHITQLDAAGTQYQLHLSGAATSGSHVTISDITDNALNVIVPNPTTLLIGGFPDHTPPTVSATVATSLVMPLNQKLVDVGLTVTASDNVTANPSVSVQVLSDEALSVGDVSYTNGVLSLRATRNNAGDGRVYLILVTATDEAGNTASSCTTVVVPYSNSPSDIASVQAQAAAMSP